MADIYGQLVKSQFENLASDISSPPTGIVYYNTTSNVVKYYNGSAWRTVASLDSTGNLLLQNASGAAPILYLSEDPDNGTSKIAVQAPASLAADYDFILPDTNGNADEFLKTDGSGNLSWAVPSGAQTSAFDVKNLSIAASVAGSAMTIALKDAGGSDASALSPINVAFRNATATTGTYAVVSLAAALSLVVSNGSTLGQVSGAANYTYVYAINSAGTMKLGLSSRLYDDGTVVTTVAEGGAGTATSAVVMYSDAIYAGVAVRLIGRVQATQTTGAWSAVNQISSGPFEKVFSIVSPWVTFTPTGSWNTNVNYTGQYRRVGDSLEVLCSVNCTGNPNATPLTFNIPNGWTVDTSKLLSVITSSGYGTDIFGLGQGNTSVMMNVAYSSTTDVVMRYWHDQGAYVQRQGSVTESAPLGWGNGDSIVAKFSMPITQFAF